MPVAGPNEAGLTPPAGPATATPLFGNPARLALLRALVYDAAGGVLRTHTPDALGACCGLSLGRTRAALRQLTTAGVVEQVRGPGRRLCVRVLSGPILDTWLAPFFVTEQHFAGRQAGPYLPGRVSVVAATSDDVAGAKALADRHRRDIGFVVRASLEASAQSGGLWVAVTTGVAEPRAVTGFAQVHHRKDGQTTLHTIAVARDRRTEGIGRGLLAAIERACRAHGMRGILLRCPTELDANKFYQALGFTLLRTEPGKRRPLHVWWRDCGRECRTRESLDGTERTE